MLVKESSLWMRSPRARGSLAPRSQRVDTIAPATYVAREARKALFGKAKEQVISPGATV